MKKSLLLSLTVLLISAACSAQTFYHFNQAKKSPPKNAKIAFPNVSIKLDTSITYNQFNFQASYVPLGFSNGGFHEIPGINMGFSVSKMWYKAKVTLTVTVEKDTAYTVNSKLGAGTGLMILQNLTTGKTDVAPAIVLAVDDFSAVAGYAIDSKMVVVGLSTTFDKLPFVTKNTNVKL